MEEGRSTFKNLTGISAGKRPSGRPKLRWEDNIRMDSKEICIDKRNWFDSGHDRGYWRAPVKAALNMTNFFGELFTMSMCIHKHIATFHLFCQFSGVHV